MSQVIEKFRPEVIVYQSGADSLTGDRLGKFNLSIAVAARLAILACCCRTMETRQREEHNKNHKTKGRLACLIGLSWPPSGTSWEQMSCRPAALLEDGVNDQHRWDLSIAAQA